VLNGLVAACRREWQVLAALVVGVAALAVQLDPAPYALAHEAVPLAIARELRGGTGLLEAVSAWPSRALAPLHPLIVSFASRAWPAFPEGLTLLAVMDACFLAGAAWFAGATAARLGMTRPTTAVSVLLGFIPLLIVLRDVRVSPYPLVIFTGTAVVWFTMQMNDRSAFVAGILSGAAGLIWPGAIGLPLAVGAAWWRRSTRVAVVSTLLGLVPVSMWWGAMWIGVGVDPGEVLVPSRTTALAWWIPWSMLTAALVAIGPLMQRFKLVSASVLFAVVVVLLGGAGVGRPGLGVMVVLPWMMLLFAEWVRDKHTRAGLHPYRVAWFTGAVGVIVAGALLVHRTTLSENDGIPAAVRLDMLAQGTLLGVEETPTLASDMPAHLAVRLDRSVRPLGKLCASRVTHLGLVFPENQAAWMVEQAALGVLVEPLFEITDGPALFTVRCDS